MIFRQRFTEWLIRKTNAFLKRWLERMRKDPDVTLAEFRDAEKVINDHFKEMERLYHEKYR